MNAGMDCGRNWTVNTKDAIEVQRWSGIGVDMAKCVSGHGVCPIGGCGRWLSVDLIRVDVKMNSVDVIVDEAEVLDRRGLEYKTGIADEQLNFMVVWQCNVAERRVSGVNLTTHGTAGCQKQRGGLHTREDVGIHGAVVDLETPANV